jgi:lipopolysaccharide export system protein LptA
MKRPLLVLLLLFTLTLAQDTAAPSETVTSSENITPSENAVPPENSPPPATTETSPETADEQEVIRPEKPVGSMTIERKDRTILVSLFAPSEEGGEFRLNVPECEEDIRLSTIYAPEPYIVETKVNEAVITSQIALSRRPPNVEDDEGNVLERGSDKQELELVGGTLNVNGETLCPENIERTESADVTLKEGRTTVDGANFLYDNNTGIGTMKGPITLDRVAQGDSPALNATSESLETNVDEDKTYLTGNVKVTSEDRVSEAATLEYNEEQGLAVLRGSETTPAKSTKGSDVLQGDVIVYFLDTNDVVVQGSLQGDIEVDLEDDGSSESAADDE